MIFSRIFWLAGCCMALSFNSTYVKAQAVISSTRSGKDTALIEDLLQKAKEAYQRSDSNALLWAKQALNLAKAQKDWNYQGKAYTRLGWIASQHTEMYAATCYADSAFYCFKLAKNEQGIAQCQNLYANIFINFDDRQRAEQYYRSALHSFEKAGDEKGRIAVLNNLGYLCIEDNRWKDGLSWLEKALPLAQASGDTLQEARIKTNMGEAFFHLGQWAKASTLLSDAYRIRRKMQGAACETLIWLIATAQEMQAMPQWKLAGIKLLETWNFAGIDQAIDSARTLAHEVEANPGLFHQLMVVEVRRAELSGNFEKALALEQERHRFLDSTKLNHLNLSAFASLQQRFDNERQRSRILELEKANAIAETHSLKQNKFIVQLLAALAILLIAAYAILRGYRQQLRTRRLESELQTRRLEYLEKQQDMAIMQAALSGQEQERERIARDLHDHLGSLLTALKLHFHRILRSSPGDIPTQDAGILRQLLDEAHSETRRLAYDMMPATLLQLGLQKTLEELCHRTTKATGIAAYFNSTGPLPELSKEKEILIYRICQEALQNVKKHANASEVSIQLTPAETSILLSIEDNGLGFNKDDTQLGMGLQSINWRTKQLGGSLYLDSKPEWGTVIQIDIPLDKKEE